MRLGFSKDDPEREHRQYSEDEDQRVEARAWVDEIKDDFRQPLVRDPVSARNSKWIEIDSRNTKVPDDVFTGF